MTILEKYIFLVLTTAMLVSCGKATVPAGLTSPTPQSGAVYPAGPVTGKYGGQDWTMSGGEARVVEGMDPGTQLLEITLWNDSRPTCAAGKHVIKGQEVHYLVKPETGEKHIVGIGADGSMIAFEYATGSTAGTEFATDGYILITKMDGGQVVGKATGVSGSAYTTGGEYTVPLCP